MWRILFTCFRYDIWLSLFIYQFKIFFNLLGPFLLNYLILFMKVTHPHKIPVLLLASSS